MEKNLRKEILFLAPIEPNGRYSGGIASYATTIVNDCYFGSCDICFNAISTCQIKRDAYSGGKISFKNFQNFFRLKKTIKNELRKKEFNTIYLNTSRNLALLKDVLLLKQKYGKKYDIIVHIHFADFNEVFHKNKFLRWLTLKLLKRLSPRIISLSDKFKDDLVKNGFSPDKIYVLRNYYSPNLTKFHSTNHVESVTNYLFVGSITKRKGIDSLLEIFNELNDEYQLFVCGTPNEKDGEELIERYSKKSNIHFVGFVEGDEKNAIFSNTDVFVLPTLAEGLPISILEAMFFGLGIITTSVGAIPEIVEPKNGFVITPGDKEKMKECVIMYHSDKLLLKKHKEQNENDSSLFSYYAFRNNLVKILVDDYEKE